MVISIANLQPDNEKAFMNMTDKWIKVVRTLLDKGFMVDLIAFTKEKDDRMIDTIIFSPQIIGRGGTPNILQRCR